MHMHPLVVVVGKLGHPLPQGCRGGVLPVDGGIHEDLPVSRPVELLGERPLGHAVPAGVRVKVGRVAKIHPAAGQVGADAGLQNLLGDGGGEHVHIRHAGDAGGDHLRQAQPCPGRYRPGVQLALGGEDVVVQPGLQVAAPAVPPHEGHGQMGVGVDEAGHHHLARAVHYPVKVALGTVGAHIGDGGALHLDIAVFENGPRLVHQNGGDVGK